MLGLHLEANCNETPGFDRKFVKLISQTIDTKANIRKNFWSKMNTMVLKKFRLNNDNVLEINEKENADQNLSILKLFSTLFKSYWQENNDSIELLDLIKILFFQFLKKFNSVSIQNDSDDLIIIYLNGLNIICYNFMHESLIRLFLNEFSLVADSNENILDIFNEKIIGFLVNKYVDKPNILFSVVNLFLIVNAEKTSKSVLNDKLDSYLLTDTSKLDSLFKFYFSMKLINEYDVVKSNMFDWFTESSKFFQIFTNDYLGLLEIRFNLALEFIVFMLNNNEKKIEKINFFYDSLVKSIIDITNIFLHDNSRLNTQLNGLVEFSLSLLFNSHKTIDNQKSLWTILINFFKIKSHSNATTNLNILVDKLANKLFKLIFEKANENTNIFRQTGEYEQLIVFIINNILNDSLTDYAQNQAIILDLIEQFDKTLAGKENGIEEFYCEILLRIKFNDSSLPDCRKLFELLLFEKSIVKSDLLQKFYLDNKNSYIYSQYHHLMIASNQVTKSNRFPQLKQLNFYVKILNLYFNSSRTENILANVLKQNQTDSALLTSRLDWWLYLAVSSLLISKLEPTFLLDLDEHYMLSMKLIDEIKLGANKLLFKSKFLKCVLTNLNLKEFADLILKSDNFELELNNLSFFLNELVDSGTHNDLAHLLQKFSFDLCNILVESRTDLEFKIKYFLYDLPFAKYSIVENTKELAENSDHYYSLFSNLFENHLAVLKKSVQTDEYFNDLANIKEFNFNLDSLIRYTRVYLNHVGLLDAAKETSSFLNEKFSKFLLQILELFMQIKEMNKSNAYSFFMDSSADSDELKWHHLSHLNNLNLFLALFFVDFKLKDTKHQQQLSQYLNSKHWDFILCYSAAQAQRLNKSLVLNELITVNFFNLVSSMIRMIQVRVRDDLSGTYPKSVYDDWQGFFSKEIFDPLLCLFVRVADSYSNEYTNSSKKISAYLFNISLKAAAIRQVKMLCSIVSQIPFERLLLNELEPKFNVLDLSIDSPKQNQSAIHLNDKLKTVFNHLVPHLKNEMCSIQLCTYKVLSKIMQNICSYYEIKSTDTDSESAEEPTQQLNIFESLPHVIKDVLFELTSLFADLNSIHFEQNILVTRLDDKEEEDETTEINKSIDQAIKLKEIRHDVNMKVNILSYIVNNCSIAQSKIIPKLANFSPNYFSF